MVVYNGLGGIAEFGHMFGNPSNQVQQAYSDEAWGLRDYFWIGRSVHNSIRKAEWCGSHDSAYSDEGPNQPHQEGRTMVYLPSSLFHRPASWEEETKNEVPEDSPAEEQEDEESSSDFDLGGNPNRRRFYVESESESESD